MRQVSSDKIYSVQEYIQHEWSASLRSEFINGQLFEMPGEKAINNRIALRIVSFLMQYLSAKGYEIYAHDIKVKIYGEAKYYYPDVFVTREIENEANQYIKNEPELIVEVVSESSQVNDYVDKFIDYTKIPSLLYYLIVEPETLLLTVYAKSDIGGCQAIKYTKPNDIVHLEKLEVSLR